MTQDILSDRDMNVIFREAHSFTGWQDMPVSEITIRAMYDLLRLGPTSLNCSPARFVIVRSDDAKKKLADCVTSTGKDLVSAAPFSVIVGLEANFYEKQDDLFIHYPEAKRLFKENQALAQEEAFRGSSIQGGYLIIAARALGLDCCLIPQIDQDKVNEAYFKDSSCRVNFICSMGYGDAAGMTAHDYRLSFDEACEIV
ncbi:Predicted reductase RutE in novel pyrimidine catabolism pathway [hydrothermal vent metagenome]|uniref:Predicted reductase RutE in novel pyrimidine catabolism pathway n=1 Tax=hydrothermal vent metagenome TaxID=652676 RepID=A0A3B1AQD5_9ZZZZ